MYPHRINLREPWQASVEDAGLVYRRAFRWPTELMPYEELWLTVGGVDAPFTVRFNQQLLGEQNDRLLPFIHNITTTVQTQNILEICCTPDVKLSVGGICRPVFLEVRRSVHLQDLVGTVQWDKEQPVIRLRSCLHGKSERRLSLVVRLNEEEVLYEELGMAPINLDVTTPPLKAPRWNPGQSNTLQHLEIHLLDPACILTQHQFDLGFAPDVQDMPVLDYPLNEPVLESPRLEEADKHGLLYRLHCRNPSLVLPYVWHHPSVAGVYLSV